jgi:hypothetical protein
MTVPPGGDLLGRRAELAGLAELLDGPGGGATVVLGEAGAGKTAGWLDAPEPRRRPYRRTLAGHRRKAETPVSGRA